MKSWRGGGFHKHVPNKYGYEIKRTGVTMRKKKAWIVGAPLSGLGCGSETRVLDIRV